MADISDITLCLTIASVALIIGWPLWAIDQSIASSIWALDRRNTGMRVRQYARRVNRSEKHVREAVTKVVQRVEAQGHMITYSEGFAIVRAAIAVSNGHGVTFDQAIDMLVVHL